MIGSTAHLRKAAILIRSLDGDTAAGLLAQLSPAEAKAVRTAIQSLGPIDPDERADVAAEYRRIGPLAHEDPRRGVELDVSRAAIDANTASPALPQTTKPFEFLEQARVESLVPYLSREHGQTVAVVLSSLAPSRAAQVLAALPARLQAEVVERLSVLGETDANSLQVLERELAEWVTRQQTTRARSDRRSDVALTILSAADPAARHVILANVLRHNRQLAAQIAPAFSESTQTLTQTRLDEVTQPQLRAQRQQPPADSPAPAKSESGNPIAYTPSPRPRIQFDDLSRLDSSTLVMVLREVDREVLVLALGGASEALIERIAGEMPRPMGKALRRRLCRLGPTRLSDVEAAQREVAAIAERTIAARRANRYAPVG